MFSIQFIKFLLVGVLNTGIDFGVLNLLMFSTGITSGFYYPIFKAISFICGVINSYIWNKRWTFQKGNKLGKKEFSKFFTIDDAISNINFNDDQLSKLIDKYKSDAWNLIK